MSESKVPFIFKRRSTRGGGASAVRRKRNATGSSSSSSGSDESTQVVRRGKKASAGNPLVQRTNKRVKLRAANNADSTSSDDDLGTKGYRSNRVAGREGPGDMGATATLDTETEKDKDAQAVYERALIINKETRGEADDKIYRGLENYSQFFEKRDTAAGNAASGSVRAKGPIRAPDHLRSTVRWDYQPDLCKDYKETGFCGFGDSCKFLHDRTDYKLGWQMEIEANKTSNRFDDSGEENYEIPSDDEHLPFKCLYCRGSFVDPVVTKCNHYYCEQCALICFKKSRKCYVCAAPTGGIFQPAKVLIERMKQMDEEERGEVREGRGGQQDEEESD